MRKFTAIILLSCLIFLNGFVSEEPQKETYIILTSKSLFLGASLFRNLRKTDYDVKLVFVEDTGSKPQEIKSYLESNFQSGFLLIIGDETVVPRGVLHPEISNKSSTVPSTVKSDTYYALLEEDLDKDGDDFEGEFFDDRITFNTRLHVGRIPFNNISDLQKVYENVVQFEKGFADKVVFAGSYISYPQEEYYGSKIYAGDGARELEVLREFFPDAFSLYEKEGSFPSAFDCDLPLDKDNFTNEIKDASIVLWSGHGSKTGAYRCIWNDKNANGIPDENYTYVPFVSSSEGFSTKALVFSGSCLNLTATGNLGEAFLLRGSPAFIGSTEVSFTPSYFSNPFDGGNGTLGYLFAKNLSLGKPVGESLSYAMNEFAAKYMFSDIEDPVTAGISILYSTNLLGDPALKVKLRKSLKEKKQLEKSAFPEDTVCTLSNGKDFELKISVPEADITSGGFYIMLPKGMHAVRIVPSSAIYDSLHNLIRINGASYVTVWGKARGSVKGEICLFNDYRETNFSIEVDGYKLCDVNFDGITDKLDLDEIVESFGKSYMDSGFNPFCDLNNDLRVNGVDLFIFFVERKSLP